MECFNSSLFYINSSLLLNLPQTIKLQHRGVYGQSEDMPAVLLFYLALQFINMFLGIQDGAVALHKNKSDSTTSDIFVMHLAILDTFFRLTPTLEVANVLYRTTSST